MRSRLYLAHLSCNKSGIAINFGVCQTQASIANKCWILRAGNSRRGGMVDWLAKRWIVVTQGGQTTVLGGLGSEMGPEPVPIMVFLKTSKASTIFGEPK